MESSIVEQPKVIDVVVADTYLVELAELEVCLRLKGQELRFTEKDLDGFQFSTPRDIIDLGERDGAYQRAVGSAHLKLSCDFKQGSEPIWKEGK